MSEVIIIILAGIGGSTVIYGIIRGINWVVTWRDDLRTLYKQFSVFKSDTRNDILVLQREIKALQDKVWEDWRA